MRASSGHSSGWGGCGYILTAWHHTHPSHTQSTDTHSSHTQSQSSITDVQIHRGKWKKQKCRFSFLEPDFTNFNCHLKICTYTHFFPQDFFVDPSQFAKILSSAKDPQWIPRAACMPHRQLCGRRNSPEICNKSWPQRPWMLMTHTAHPKPKLIEVKSA